MEAIRQWAFSLCAAALVCAVIELLLPSVPLAKMVRLSLSVFFLCVLIQPIGLGRLREDMALQTSHGMAQAEKVAEDLSKKIQGELSEAVGRSIEEKLESIGLSPEEYHLKIRPEEGRIHVTVLLDADSAAIDSEIIRCLEQDLLIQIDVIRGEAK